MGRRVLTMALVLHLATSMHLAHVASVSCMLFLIYFVSLADEAQQKPGSCFHCFLSLVIG